MMKSSQIKAYSNLVKNNFLNICNVRTYPRFAHFFITWRCNLRCRDCSIWQKDTKDELDTTALLAIIRKLSFLDIIKITGGEPFIREDLPVVIKEIRNNIDPYIIQITTNGTYTERMVELVKQVHYPGLQLRISLDGIGDLHDRIRGREGCYKKIHKTIFALVELKKKYSFQLGINYGLRKETVPFLEEVLKLCMKNEIGLIIGYPIKPFLKDTDFDSSDFSVEFPEEVLKSYEELVYLQKPSGNLLESFFSNFLNKSFLKKESADRFKFDCGQLRDLIYILPNGNLVICGLRQKEVANLLEEDFKDVWFGEKIKQYKREIRDCPGCLQKSIKLMSKIYKVF